MPPVRLVSRRPPSPNGFLGAAPPSSHRALTREAGDAGRPKLSRAVRAYALAIPALAALVFAGWLVVAHRWGGDDVAFPAFLPALFALMTAASRLAPLRLANRRKHTVATAPNFAALLLFGPAVAMLVAGGGTLAAFALLVARRQRRGWDGVFNTGQIALAVGVAAIVLYHRAPLRVPVAVRFGAPATMAALGLAAAILYLANTAAVAVMIAIQQRKNPVRVWLAGRRTDLLTEATLFLVGALAAAAIQESPWAVVFLVVPTVMVHQTLQRAARLTEQADAAAAREADRLKGELLSTVSHELRTPLGMIKGAASGLLAYDDRLTGADRVESLRAIDEAADRLTELVDNLLDVQRLQAGRLPIAHDLVNLADVAAAVATEMGAAGARHRLDLDIGPDIPPVWGDGRRLRQVVQNLADNAVKYSPPGGRITVRVARAGTSVELRVEDEGVGIPKEHLGRVFDRFHRVDGALTRRVPGTGLGLAIVRELVDAHSGTVRVESAGPRSGSTFVVALPIADVEGDAG